MKIRNVVSSCSYLHLKIRKRTLEDRKRMLEDRKRSVLIFILKL